MTEQQLREIEKRAAKATEGPWVKDYETGWINTASGKPVIEYAGCGSHDAKWPNEHDQSFVCAARQDIPVLVSEVRELRELLNDLASEASNSVELSNWPELKECLDRAWVALDE